MTTIIQKQDIFPLLTGRTPLQINRLLSYFLKDAGIPLTKEQWSLMAVLWEKDGCSQQVLADATYRDRGSITRLLDNLSKEGLIERRPSTADRRTNLIYLAKKGRALEKPVLEILERVIEVVTMGIEKVQIDVVREVFSKINENIEQLSKSS